ncbi:hypothetical protein LIER_10216 [Lithospermum erythrorhizon]|uniref:Reverse transcriptase n=1 Tax=Lithospermum erythrorhizon TaxID=34254 RepID=A0AAV3PKH3_LITER
MAGNMAPRPDRMLALFFQHYWDIVGEDVCKLVMQALNEGRFLRKFNFTLISLIPKVEKQLCMAQFCPITLSYEAHHVLKSKKSGKEGYMSIKLDLLKAYDRVEWRLLRAMLVLLPMKGVLRQGDPLSPYLYIICTEGLISLLKGACIRGKLRSCIRREIQGIDKGIYGADDSSYVRR